MSIKEMLPARVAAEFKWTDIPGNARKGFCAVVMPKQKLIYIPIAKCAMSSMKFLLGDLGLRRQHPDGKKGRGIYPTIPNRLIPLLGDEFTAFAIVRHPLDRSISCYTDRREESTFRRIYGLNRNDTKQQFVEKIIRTPNSRAEKHVLPQTYYLWHDGKPVVQALVPFERLPCSLEDFLRLHGLDVKMPHRRKTVHAPWRNAWTKDQEAKLRRRYHNDFEALSFD